MPSVQKLVSQNSVLILALSLAYFFNSLQLTALVVLLYLLSQFLLKQSTVMAKNKTYFDFFCLTLIVFCLIFATGGLSSPVFFLSYFLLFGIVLLFEPSAALALATIASVFLLLHPRGELLPELLQIASLFLISPLALIFGSQYLKLKQQQAIKIDIAQKLEAVDNSTPSEKEAIEAIRQELNE